MARSRRPADDVTAELRRVERLGVFALAAVALGVPALLVVRHSSAGWLTPSARIELVAVGAVYVGVGVALLAMHRMHRRLEEQARALDTQREMVEQRTSQLEAQAAEVHLKTQELETANAGLGAALREAQAARVHAESVARQKAHVAAFLDAALVSVPVGFGFLDKDLRFLRVNATLARYNNLAAEDHIGLLMRELDEPLADVLEPVLRGVLESGKPAVNLEFTADAPRRPGDRRHWLASYFPIITADNETVGIGAAIADITDRKMLESQLFHAQKMEAVGRLAGGIAHDFNNVLTIIGNYIELMMLGSGADPYRDDLEQIRAATARGATLTRQLLVFSRKQALEPRIVSPNDVVGGVHALLRRLLAETIEISTWLAPNVDVVRVDVGQLEQVLMNLAINAADAMPNGGRLNIATQNETVDDAMASRKPELKPGRYVLISVADTGAGIDSSTLDHIFEPFFTTKEPGRGTGLGLSIVYGIVTQSGGHVAVASEVGLGTTFSIYLPAVSGPATDQRPQLTASNAASDKSSQFAG